MKEYKLQLEPRDLEVLSVVQFWGVLGLGQLEGLAFKKDASAQERFKLFFNEYPREAYDNYPCRRLLKLERQGFLHPNSYLNFPKLYTLTEKGCLELKERGLSRLPGFRDSISEALVRHELTVNAAGLVMKELLGLDVRVERERFAWNKRGGWSPAPERLPVSDLWIADSERPKAVEIELSQKSWRRYQFIWEAYRRRLRPAGVVLYLTSWPSGVDCLLRHARRFEADHIYVCGLQEFKESLGRGPFVSCQGQSISLASAALAEAVQ